MKEIVTFIHTSGESDHEVYAPLIPIGLVALASFLEQNNIKTEIVNLEMEKQINPQFDLPAYLKEGGRRLFGLNLHWHSQSAKVVEISRLIKKEIPNSKIILGGFTASYFASEIIKSGHSIDFIIKGEAEVPLLKLINEIVAGKEDLASVPNLVWRRNGIVVINKKRYNTSQEIINRLEFGNLHLIKNFVNYQKISASGIKNDFFSDQPAFYYNCGRGCPVNCVFCGGSNISQKIINNRQDVILISPDAVIRELKKVNNEYGIKYWHTSFDPFPDQNYYINLFQKIRNEKLDLSLGFECWALPSEKFIDEFGKTFGERSSLQISPECGSQYIRKMNKGYYYSNVELIKTLRYIDRKKIRAQVFFSAGLAFETKEDIKKTLNLIKVIRDRFKKTEIKASYIEMEPGSPWHLDQEKFGIKSRRKKFNDFYKDHKRDSSPGYSTREFSESKIKKIISFYNAYCQQSNKLSMKL